MVKRSAILKCSLTILLAGMGALTLMYWQGNTNAAFAQETQKPSNDSTIDYYRVNVIDSYPHDTKAYTQGLEWRDGVLFESTGLYQESTIRTVDPVSGAVIQSESLANHEFAEGMTLVGDRLYQITWREGTAHVYDAATLQLIENFYYDGEGWGLCYDGNHLIMSDGSEKLSFRDPETFDEVTSRTVTLKGKPLNFINELEYVDGVIYANIYKTDRLVTIDPETGNVTGVIVAEGLLSRSERAKTDVLNGIAYHPETKMFFITGKLWPKMFLVEFVKTETQK